MTKYEVQAPFELSGDDKSMIQEKLGKLSRFSDRITNIRLFFKMDDATKDKAVTSKLEIRIPGQDIFVEDIDQNAIRAFNKTFNSAKRQLVKRNDKNKEHHSDVREMIDIVYFNK